MIYSQKWFFYEKSRRNYKKSKIFQKKFKIGPNIFGYFITLQKKIQIKIPSRLKDIIKSFKSKVSLSLQTDLHKNQQAKVRSPTVGAKNVCLKYGHTTMSHYIQDYSKMRSRMSTHSSLLMECKGLQWRPSVWPSCAHASTPWDERFKEKKQEC